MLYIKKLEDELSKESICVFNTFENIILKHLKKIKKFQTKQTTTN